ncbi:MetQ/NlpA family ABC transporter substrate-binding protein [Faecalicatena contorta]|jgi:D-methionine transport system substrate-binding protein|uniref:D-methionine transport system substrate-binding protein n=1 Tax=Faecalicatena contorta TaxID=39482 RepID=A0A315ZTQ4_9FIRM|nr:MetQ/NlpA family ABC transporter substrate-binding protein [Faecalicatena contorta]MBA4698342.1 metal ABC transporter substrate-binding protein [Ruminococcus sp.]PWJ48553.1 D-methionine transport system substrate-binding protein [Faecalicatena contorta]SUQ15289.1 D-methionine transport system substrate-binding protein [Faecalicatena contorta]
MKKKMLSILLTVVMTGAVMTGCGGADSKTDSKEASGEKNFIKIGIRADMVDQLASVCDKIEGLGYTVEEKVFDDSVQPDVALAEGSIDMNWYQHEPYMKSYNEENGTDLVMIEPKTFYPLFAMYSDKWESVAELPDGAVIGLCNDATNQARGLNMLQAQGLITLDDSVESPTMYDVKENPHNFEFIEAEMSVLPQSLGDADAICLAAGHMVNAGLPADGYLCTSDDNDVYAVGFAVRAEDKDAKWAKEIAEVVQCDELAEYFKTEKQGTQIPCWE